MLGNQRTSGRAKETKGNSIIKIIRIVVRGYIIDPLEEVDREMSLLELVAGLLSIVGHP